jgi:hypothetical protein
MNKRFNRHMVSHVTTFILGIIILFSSIISFTTTLAIHEPFHILPDSATNDSTNTINNFILYENPDLGLKIQHPSDWQKKEGENRISFISPAENPSDKYLESIAISLFPAGSVSFFPSSNLPFSEVVSRTINYLEQSKANFDLIESNEIVLNGKPAYNLVYNYVFSNNGPELTKSSGILMTNGDYMYVISYFAEPAKYSLYSPILQQMLDSLQLSTIDSSPVSQKLDGGDGDGDDGGQGGRGSGGDDDG